jgi:Domain of unknown function (DUF1840)
MIYKFKSPATGDVIMLAAQGEQFLHLLGREPAAQGIIEPAAMAAALAALEQAVTAQANVAASPSPEDPADAQTEVALHQRLWPMIDMLRRAQAAGKPVVWGV